MSFEHSCHWLHPVEQERYYRTGEWPKIFYPHGCDQASEAFLLRAERLRLRAVRDSLTRRWAGLNDPLHGYINKHVLHMKWKRKKEGIELRYFA